ncbi:hypothetical protein EDD93_2336 [Streptomyces sp. 840.1]|uniref:hypothetical protein n=1 Tax=Streptomyces sp. 840.1 TaxID=2485152 RepID=UPI000F488FDD|nr:hypothetical protein [Streptomyces sp. 840.1]ROQ67886.1 hypothetical protein EDD93_2336 [Streptomyces sp. 840.1]
MDIGTNVGTGTGRDGRRESRREALSGIAGFAVAAAGATAGMLVWAPYARRGLFGSIEGHSEWDVLWHGLPVMTLGGVAAALGTLWLVRGRWLGALGFGALLAVLAVVGVTFGVLDGPPPPCGSVC